MAAPLISRVVALRPFLEEPPIPGQFHQITVESARQLLPARGFFYGATEIDKEVAAQIRKATVVIDDVSFPRRIAEGVELGLKLFFSRGNFCRVKADLRIIPGGSKRGEIVVVVPAEPETKVPAHGLTIIPAERVHGGFALHPFSGVPCPRLESGNSIDEAGAIEVSDKRLEEILDLLPPHLRGKRLAERFPLGGDLTLVRDKPSSTSRQAGPRNTSAGEIGPEGRHR